VAHVPTHPPYDLLLASADSVAAQRPEVDLELAREVFAEAATLLHDGLVLDELDDHDQHLVVQALCDDLVAPDPGAALRARAALVRAEPASWHDPDEAWSVLLTTVGLFQL